MHQKRTTIAVIGPLHVGKSTLVKRILTKKYDATVAPTIGFDYRIWDREFEFYDLSGAFKYRDMNKKFVSRAQIALLCCDSVSTEQELLNQWMDNLPSKSIMCYTKGYKGKNPNALTVDAQKGPGLQQLVSWLRASGDEKTHQPTVQLQKRFTRRRSCYQ